MDIIAEIRRRYHIDNESVTSLAKTFNLSRPTIRKHINTVEEPVYQRQNQPHPKLGSFHDLLEAWLEQEAHFPRKQRRTAQRLYEMSPGGGLSRLLYRRTTLCETLEEKASQQSNGQTSLCSVSLSSRRDLSV